MKRTRVRDRLIPGTFPTYPQSAIPTACAEGHTIRANAQAADTVFVASQDTDTLSLERIPNIARPIIISTKQDAPGDGEGNRGDTTKDIIVRECVQLSIGPDIEEPARGIVGAGGEGVAIWEESWKKIIGMETN